MGRAGGWGTGAPRCGQRVTRGCGWARCTTAWPGPWSQTRAPSARKCVHVCFTTQFEPAVHAPTFVLACIPKHRSLQASPAMPSPSSAGSISVYDSCKVLWRQTNSCANRDWTTGLCSRILATSYLHSTSTSTRSALCAWILDSVCAARGN